MQYKQLTEANIKDAPTTPGAYKIAIFRNGKPLPIHRFFGIDQNGIIDIGESHNLRKRISSFKRNIEKGNGGHMAGWRFHFLNLPFKDLRFCYWPCKNKDKAYAKEHELMKEYLDKHKELPPLNYKYNWQ